MEITGNIVDVVNRKIFPGCIVVENGIIIDVFSMPDLITQRYIMPGFIDVHVHIESSMLIPSSFARIAVVHGTIATISDPHEIANVLGHEGIGYMIKNGSEVPFKFNWTLPSCVPATSFETSGATINAEQTALLFEQFTFVGLSEMMNFPGVFSEDKEVIKKIKISIEKGYPVDGHAPGITGNNLVKYIKAGITTDHEASTLEEAQEKISLGMKILIREGSSAKNFEALFPLIDLHTDKIMICCDDIHPEDLMNGHINKIAAKAIAKGLDLFYVLMAACINPIKHYRLNCGMLQKGDMADFIIVSDLKEFDVLETWIDGHPVFVNGKVLFSEVNCNPINNFKALPITAELLKVKKMSDKLNVIEVIDGSLFTRAKLMELDTNDVYLNSDIKQDILKIVVVNRYKISSPIVGFVHGFGFKYGAIAGSVAHDSHNIIAIGVSDLDICNAINEIIQIKGGVTACNNENKITLPLPVAGLMSFESAEIVANLYEELNITAKNSFGSKLYSPFMTMSFLSLLVIPEFKIGDKGLFDVNEFRFTSLFS